MPETFDYIVLGAGGFGSSVLYHLARRGARAVAIERFGVAHDRGSSHGETRIIRKAYFEHPNYVPLLLRAYELWEKLEAESGKTLYRDVGLVVGGTPDSTVITGAMKAATLHGLSVEQLTSQSARKRFPAYAVPEDYSVVYEAEAGYLFVEDCVRTALELAQRRGGELRTEETVLDWKSDGQKVRVRTNRGEYEASGLVITAGAWAANALSELQLPLQVLRKVLLWFETPQPQFDASAGNPCFFFETPGGEFYGFPRIDGLVKMAQHSGGQPVANPLDLDRELHSADVAPVSEFIGQLMPQIPKIPKRHATCMYTQTPDSHFIVDLHPRYPNVAIGAGFSGHGFKFTSSIGEALANLAVEGRADQSLDFLSLARPALKKRPE